MSRIDTFALARQSAFGTMVTLPTGYVQVPVESADIDPNREIIEVTETAGDRFPTSLDYGTRQFGVTASLAPHLTSLGAVLSPFLGRPPAPTGTNPYVHTFDPVVAGATLPWNSILLQRADPADDIVDVAYDALGDSLTLTMEANNVLRAEASFVAAKLNELQSPQTLTSDSSARFKFSSATASVLTSGGTAVTVPLRSFSITYTNALDTDYAVLGSTDLQAIGVGNANCEVSFVAYDTSGAGGSPQNLIDHYRRALAATPVDNQITLTYNAGASAQMTITVYAAEYISAPAPISAGDVLKTLEVTARAHKTGSNFVTITLTNTQNTQY